MNQPWKLFAVGLISIVLATGCGGSGKPAAQTPPTPADNGGPVVPGATDSASSPIAPAAKPGLTKIPPEKLAIGDYMPPLDDDRVEIAKPVGWQALPRDSDFLTRFYQTNRNGLPRIEITVEPRTYGDLTTVTAENVESFVKLVAAELGDLELIENVIPLQIGDTSCARYVGRVDLNLQGGQKIIAERQRLLVLRDSRLYTIDLLVLPNTLLRSRDAAYAVCASLRFGEAKQPAAAGALLPE